MNKVQPNDDWPQSWKESYPYDLLELYGGTSNLGYAYAYANRSKHTFEMIQKVAPHGAKILDVAAAQGNFSLKLAEMGYEVTWNDLREELVDYVKLKYERGIVHYKPGNAFELKFDGQFDVVLITEIIEHVAHPDQFLQAVAVLVKPGGYIVMTTPNGGYFLNKLPKFSECLDPSQFEIVQFKPNSDGHIFLLHLDEVEPLARKAGLNVIEKRVFTNVLTNGHLKTSTALRVLPRGAVQAIEKGTSHLPLALRKKVCVGIATLLYKPA